MPCSFGRERALRKQGILLVAGVDEAGRGPLAGPVVAAAVVFLKHRAPDGLNDSKVLTENKREAFFQYLTTEAHVRWAVSIQEVEVIDQINILRASQLAMREALLGLAEPAHHALVDGLAVPNLPVPHTPLVSGDALSLSIAAASVIAKVTRDRLMTQLHETYPHYGFDRHKGYGTKEHLTKLREHGPCPIHRRSFEPVAQLTLF